MIERLENLLQLVLLGICAGISLKRSLTTKKHTWAMLFLSAFVYFLGDLYWQFYMIFYGETPPYSFIPYLSWYASFLFLLMLIIGIEGGERRKRYHNAFLWLIPVFTLGAAAFFTSRGVGIIDAIISVSIFTALFYRCLGALISRFKEDSFKNSRMLYILTLICLVCEYTSNITSCFWMGDTLLNPYFWSDTILSLSFLLLPAALKKAEEE